MAKGFGFTDILNQSQNEDSISSFKRVTIDKLIENEENKYPIADLEQLADSIESLGLLQPLLVKKVDGNKYVIIAGHRRYNAIKLLINEDRIDSDFLINVKELPPDEDPLITRFKLHETNLQTRSLLKMSEEEKIDIIKDYVDLINTAREKSLTINGKEIKGKTRELVAERFNISSGTAGSLIAKTKGNNNEKTKKSIFESLLKKTEKISKEEVSEEDKKYIEQIVSILNEYILENWRCQIWHLIIFF